MLLFIITGLKLETRLTSLQQASLVSKAKPNRLLGQYGHSVRVHIQLVDDDSKLAAAVDVMAGETVAVEFRTKRVAEHVRWMHDRT
jgi:hypothetical protein